eukprot:GHVP01025065.1.p1 GENE.GHVP01025065.1~~GHVP01025065.1.p1  ORF type:complete len:227 (+),score=31.87 GHVP01025065.1:60-683(+)
MRGLQFVPIFTAAVFGAITYPTSAASSEVLIPYMPVERSERSQRPSVYPSVNPPKQEDLQYSVAPPKIPYSQQPTSTVELTPSDIRRLRVQQARNQPIPVRPARSVASYQQPVQYFQSEAPVQPVQPEYSYTPNSQESDPVIGILLLIGTISGILFVFLFCIVMSRRRVERSSPSRSNRGKPPPNWVQQQTGHEEEYALVGVIHDQF